MKESNQDRPRSQKLARRESQGAKGEMRMFVLFMRTWRQQAHGVCRQHYDVTVLFSPCMDANLRDFFVRDQIN